MPHIVNTERNDWVFKQYRDGKTYDEIAAEAGVSRTRIQQVVGIYINHVIKKQRTGEDDPIAEFKRLRRAIQAEHRAAVKTRRQSGRQSSYPSAPEARFAAASAS